MKPTPDSSAKSVVTAASIRIQISEAKAEVEETAQVAQEAKADYKRARKTFKRAKKAAKQARKNLKALVCELEKLPTRPAIKRAKRKPARTVKPAPSPLGTTAPLVSRPDSSGPSSPAR